MNVSIWNLSTTNTGLYIGLYLRSHKLLLMDVDQNGNKGNLLM